jgi:vitamin-K-epoxide reductase (warfarin-sensitive)
VRLALSATSNKLLVAVAVLACAGIVVSSVSLAHHYSHSKTEFCDFSQAFNCDVVNRSEYSTVQGIPVALIGILGYGALLLLGTVYRAKAETPIMLLGAGVAGLGFALYLTYIEAYVLDAWCILCLSSLSLIFAITVLSAFVFLQRKRSA